MTRRTDEYPFSDGCNEPELAGRAFGGAAQATTNGDEGSSEDDEDDEASGATP